MTKKKRKIMHDAAENKVAANMGELCKYGIIDLNYKMMPQYTKPPYDKMTYAEILAAVKAKQ